MSRVGDELFKREMRGGMSGKEIVTLREGVCSEAWMGAGSVWDVEVFRNGWEEGTLQEGMKSLGRDESLHGNVSTFFDGVQEKK